MCHTVEKRNVGPAFKDVSAAYKNQADAEDYLVNKIKKGGRGKWGVVPMPANEGKLTDDEFREVVRWIRAM
jgi:cytochrome c